ncbi:MAG: MBL fold metallo-hydrolase [Pseudomonadota bacterium]|uniref:MBL fold metallo-hydrolase n=1 Tax=Thermithiobacillus tepidarius TaxID=929 RepID=UPI000413AD39|nr:MBL fold metallo-hydrolase [Thermithiobacillus tepidarius]
MPRATLTATLLAGTLALSGQAWAAPAAKAPPIRADYPVEKIAPHTYVIHASTELPNPQNQGFMSNMAFVVTKAGVVVFDTGASVQAGEFLVRKIKSVTKQPVTHVFNSHKHGDHWLGNQAIAAAWPRARFFAHADDIAAIKNGEGQMWIDMMQDMTKGATAGTAMRVPDNPVKAGDRFQVGGMQFIVHYYGHAHTPGSIMVEVPEEKVVLMGDNLFAERAPGLRDANIKGNLLALEKVKDLPDQHIVPGHGRTDGKPLLDDFHAYLDTLRQSVKKYQEQGLSDFEMKDKVIADMARFQHLVGFQDVIGQHINRVYLELEQESF